MATGRRDLTPVAGVSYIRADLTDAAATQAALTPAGDVTHLFFGAFQYAEDRYEEVRVNVEMFKNPLDALRAPRAPLRRVVSCEVSKAYGALMGPMRTPAKERDPRVPGQLFYFDQEDLLAARGAADGFFTTTLRPDFIAAGIGLGSFANLVTVVAIHATVCKAQGLPLYFPGGVAAYGMLFHSNTLFMHASRLLVTMVTASSEATVTYSYRFAFVMCAP